MHEQIQIKIGANASQAFAEMDRVRKSALSFKSLAFGAGGFFGFAGMGAVYKIF